MNDLVPDLVVLSHLRWPWVWQRPQHLVSRLARRRAADGARTWFVEEPTTGEVAEPQLGHEDCGDVTRVWLVVPPGRRVAGLHGFGCDGSQGYAELLANLLAEQARPPGESSLHFRPEESGHVPPTRRDA